ncbi:hypothetical protein F4778DRAFT_772959 [Xylariomycetidae sp. FL2044]|nr:hypothetical protein F4778DRAFT_772959 [Xylariomycetidae sp. FL2044]
MVGLTELRVSIVGGGIAGLSAAIALSRVGHIVRIFEKSSFKTDAGAAVTLGPNATRVLSRWGFDFEKAGALDYSCIRRYKADTLELGPSDTFKGIQQKYAGRWLMFHRGDLHSGLRDLAKFCRPIPYMTLGNEVIDIDIQNSTLRVASGEKIESDLIIVADGAHSRFSTEVVGHDFPIKKSPLSIYRFLQPMEKVLESEETAVFYKDRPPGMTVFYRTELGRPGSSVTTYPIRHGTLLNVGILHPTKDSERAVKGWDSPATHEDVEHVLNAQGFHPAVKALCRDATDVKVYNLMSRDPYPTYQKGRAALVGDAAHLMLPTHAQGASMAIEDAAALGVLFSSNAAPADVPARLRLYDELRLPRARAAQIMSNMMAGPNNKDSMITEIRRYYGDSGSIPGRNAMTFSEEYNDFFFSYNVVEEARKLLKGHIRSGSCVSKLSPQLLA